MRIYLPVLILVALLGVSAGSAQQNDATTAKPEKAKASVYADLSQAPEKARAKPNPYEGDPDAVAAGRKLFQRYCAECHGSAGEGSRKAPSLRAHEVQRETPGAVFWILTNGVVRRGMPVWSRLPEPQRWQLVTYIRSLGPSSGEKTSADEH